MKLTVMNIQSEKDIEEELIMVGGSYRHNNLTEVDDQLLENNEEFKEKPTREKIQNLGNRLVDSTDEVLKGIKRTIAQFNKVFEFVYIQNFIFEESDYEIISFKEVKEIKEIFKTFEIRIKELTVKRVR